MYEPFKQHNESLLYGKWQEKYPNICIGFTTRIGGTSKAPYHSLNLGLHVADNKEDVITNRKQLAKELTFPIENWVIGEQVHGTKIIKIDHSHMGKGTLSHGSAIKDVDGLITNSKGILCTAFFADCVPLYFYDPVTEYIGIAHAGWKGTVHRIAEKMVIELKKLGVEMANLLALIGPSISKYYYEVDDRVIRMIRKEDLEKTTSSVGENRFQLDLRQLNAEILLQSGVLRHNIDITNYCTFRDKDLFFSHRRDQGKTGRMLGFIGMKKENSKGRST